MVSKLLRSSSIISQRKTKENKQTNKNGISFPDSIHLKRRSVEFLKIRVECGWHSDGAHG